MIISRLYFVKFFLFHSPQTIMFDEHFSDIFFVATIEIDMCDAHRDGRVTLCVAWYILCILV